MTDEKTAPPPDEDVLDQAETIGGEPEPEPAPAAAPADSADSEPIAILNRSIWHKPFQFLGSLLLMLLALVLVFFLPEGWEGPGKLLVAAIFVAGLLWMLSYLFVSKMAATYTITRRRCTAEIGFISREIREVEIRHIRNINVKQSILQRLFGIGDVEISTAGGAGIEVVFESIPDPLGIRRLIMDRK